MKDLRSVGVSIMTIGQYLQPTKKHLPVVEYVHPDKFKNLRKLVFHLDSELLKVDH